MYKQGGTYHAISSFEFAQRVNQVAAGLVSLGVEKGDRLALLSENRTEWAISDLGILTIGAINVPLYNSLPPVQIQNQLNDGGVKIAIVSNRLQLRKIQEIASQVPTLIKVVVMDEGQGDSQVIGFQELLDRGKEALRENPALVETYQREVRAQDLASIIYTSGTTDSPKGVMLTHSNIVSNVLGCAEALSINSGDVALSFLPLCHIFERTADYLMMYRGATIAYAESVETVPQNMLEVKPTIVPSVPRLFEKMHARIMEAVRSSPALKKRLMSWAFEVGKEYGQRIVSKSPVSSGLDMKYRIASKLVFSKLRHKVGGRLRFFISGGAPLDKELANFFFSAGITILEGYGLTETSPVITVNREGNFKFGTVGLPLPNVEIKIAADGEILTRGPAVMLGYYQKEKETREVLEGGWLHTGDIGQLDEEGFLRITDRKKDLIVTAGGKNVAPQKIEMLLKTNSYILNLIVLGDRHPFISALIVPNPDRVKAYSEEKGLHFNTYTELVRSSQIHDLIMQEICLATSELAPFEQIRKIALLEKDFSIESGELTPTMKVRRRIIEEKHRDLIDALYSETHQSIS